MLRYCLYASFVVFAVIWTANAASLHITDHDGGTEQNDRGDLSIGVNTGEIDSVNFGKKRPGQGPSGPGRFVPHTHCVDDVNFRERPKGFRNFPGLGRGKTIRIWDRRTGCWESVKFDDENPNEEVQTKFEDFGQDDIGQIGWNTGTLTQNYHGVDPATNPGVKEIGVNQGTHFLNLFGDAMTDSDQDRDEKIFVVRSKNDKLNAKLENPSIAQLSGHAPKKIAEGTQNDIEFIRKNRGRITEVNFDHGRFSVRTTGPPHNS